ncbi:hypothetical protein JX265_007274 [Neoarthrinium moseri]|uniref:Uncharacterized protein n=1 Tax=Neoarthrinium moseri TaxID=1658444 RepID=A0A9P9WKA1_9PEZI|nr:hypothetical protein JX265_007274 [Neoarthrinium moseri]
MNGSKSAGEPAAAAAAGQPQTQTPASTDAAGPTGAEPPLMAGANGGSSLTKKRKKEGLKPIITTEGAPPTGSLFSLSLLVLGASQPVPVAAVSESLLWPLGRTADGRLSQLRQCESAARGWSSGPQWLALCLSIGGGAEVGILEYGTAQLLANLWTGPMLLLRMSGPAPVKREINESCLWTVLEQDSVEQESSHLALSLTVAREPSHRGGPSCSWLCTNVSRYKVRVREGGSSNGARFLLRVSRIAFAV